MPGPGRHSDVHCEKWFPNQLVSVGQAFLNIVFVPLKTGFDGKSYATRLLEKSLQSLRLMYFRQTLESSF